MSGKRWGGGHLRDGEEPRVVVRCAGRRLLVIVLRDGEPFLISARMRAAVSPLSLESTTAEVVGVRCPNRGHGSHVIELEVLLRALHSGKAQNLDVRVVGGDRSGHREGIRYVWPDRGSVIVKSRQVRHSGIW